MKVTSIDHNDNATQKGKPVKAAAISVEESDLSVEELEQVIAPKLTANHNETMVSDESRKSTKDSDVSDRRKFLKVAGAGLVAASVPAIASGAITGAQTKGEDEATTRSRSVFMYGCGWNRALPGAFGEACISFDARAELGGTGVGTFRDDVNPEINSQFQINSATRQGDEYTFEGVIIASRRRDLIGMQVRMVAESLGNGRGRATITIESGETNLVVIAIIAVLMGLLLPAVQ